MSEQAVVTPEFELRHRLALALDHAGLKVEDMAIELGRAETTIRNYLSGRTSPSRSVLIVWAMKCGVPLDWLMGSGPRPDARRGSFQSGWLSGTAA